MLGYSDKLFLLLMFKPCLFQFNVFSCASCFFSKHKERTVQLLFVLVVLEKRVDELCNVPIPQMFLLAFVGLVNPSGGCATEISYRLSQCGKQICQLLKYYIQCHKTRAPRCIANNMNSIYLLEQCVANWVILSMTDFIQSKVFGIILVKCC